MLDKKECTTILLRKHTTNKLKTMGNKGETYDDVINRLIEEYPIKYK